MSDQLTYIFEGLNPEQKDAVTHIDGPLLVIAGAGSGKTRVLTNRIAYFIHQGIPASNILAVTFTNKAANEMKERVQKLLASAPTSQSSPLDVQPTIGTFHAVCMRFLRVYAHMLGFENAFVIYDTADQEALMKSITKDMNLTEKVFAPRAVLSKISQAKNHLIGPEEFLSKAENQFMMMAGQCYREYQQRLKLSAALDFDDIIMKTIELFRTHPEVLERYQEQYRYIMVDEYQDTNYAQYVLVDLLSKRYQNLMVVGDSDQSIYGFRGANASNILDFEKQFKGAKRVVLSTNYRSTESILNVANSVIEKNISRHKKEMRPVLFGGDKVCVAGHDTQRDEALTIAERILESREKNTHLLYKDCAILYRTNAQSRVFEEAFMRYGIPYKIVGGVKFYTRKEIKDIIGYLRVIQNPNDSVSLLRIINTPPRKIGQKTIDTLRDRARNLGMSLFDVMMGCEGVSDLQEGKKDAVKKFVELIEHLKEKAHEHNVSGLLKYLLVETGYKEFLLSAEAVDTDSVSSMGVKERRGVYGGDAITRLENVHELISVASKYNELEPATSLSTFLEEISLIADVDSLDNTDNAVVLMTIHSAKGLEFHTVFLAGLEEGLFPHFNSLTSGQDLEEERRLMYVAVTRAKQNLTLSFARTRMLYGDNRECVPSQFLKEIPEEFLEGDVDKIYNTDRTMPPRIHGSVFGTYTSKYMPISHDKEEAEADITLLLTKGDRVMHKMWGEGVVTEVTGGIVAIDFKDRTVGSKKLAINIAPLTKIS